MDYFFIIFPKLLSFLILILMGYVISKLGIVKECSLSSISGFLIKLVLPCLTVSLLYENKTTFAGLFEYHRVVMWQVGMYFVMAAVGILCSRLAKLPPLTASVHQGCMVGGNYGFVVIPLIMALFTEAADRQYIPICSAVDTVVVWTLGLALFTRGKAGSFKELGKKLFNPILVSIFFALIINSMDIVLPEPFVYVADSVGNVSYSMGLIYLGCTICFLKKPGLSELRNITMIVGTKLVLIPAAVFLISSYFLPVTESLILMLIAGAPSMTTSSMIAKQYGLDEGYASTAVFVTTISCMVTIPLVFLITAWIR